MSISRRNFLKTSGIAVAAGGLTLATGKQAKAEGAPSATKNILMVVANEIQHPTLGFPLGFWAAELTHPFAEFLAHGYTVTIASLEGGKVIVDGYSDPRHESGYAAYDFVSLGFLESPTYSPLLDTTTKLSDIRIEDHDAIIVAGGQSPMFTFRENKELQNLIKAFYVSGKPTAALCHGTASLVDIQMDDGSYLVAGKSVTGFSAAEDAYVDDILGIKLFDWWVEPALRERGANYSEAGMWANYAIADGNLITGQQQMSGGKVAQLVLEQLV